MKKQIFCAVLFLLLSGCASVPATHKVVSRNSDPHLLIKGLVKGQPVTLAFDTGAGQTTLFARTAQRLGLQFEMPEYSDPKLDTPKRRVVSNELPVEMLGSNFKMAFDIIRIPPNIYPELDGILSWNNILTPMYGIDADQRTLDFVPMPTAEDGVWQRFPILEDKAGLLVINAGTVKQPLAVLIDTGMDAGIDLNRMLWQKIRAEQESPLSISGSYSPLFGFEVKETFHAKTLALGRLQISDTAVKVFGAIEEKQPYFQAIIGFRALTRLKVIVYKKEKIVYISNNKEPVSMYDHNRLGAVFVPPHMKDLRLLGHVIKGSPADRAGVKTGDVLLKINDLDVTKWNTAPGILPLSRFWKKPTGTTLILTLKRVNEIVTLPVELENIFE